MTKIEQTNDFVALFPVDFDHWVDRPSVTLWEATLLSLGIDPESVEEVLAQERTSIECADVGLDAVSHPDLGMQHAGFHQRMRDASHAISSEALRFERRHNVDWIKLPVFVAWAIDRQWAIPVGLVELAKQQRRLATQSASPTASLGGPREETLERRALLLTMVEAQLLLRPDLAKSKIAAAIAYQLSRSQHDWQPSAHHVRNLLFYIDPPIFSAEELKRAKRNALASLRSRQV